MRQLWALVHAASACERSLVKVATRGRSAEGSEIATKFIYVSKVCQSCHQYVLEQANLCVNIDFGCYVMLVIVPLKPLEEITYIAFPSWALV